MRICKFLILLLLLSLSACGSLSKKSELPPWSGKYTREDGVYDLYLDNGPLLDVIIVPKGKDPKVMAFVKGGFLAEITGQSAQEMQHCRKGLCAKECLSHMRQTLDGIVFESCNDNGLDGLYR